MLRKSFLAAALLISGGGALAQGSDSGRMVGREIPAAVKTDSIKTNAGGQSRGDSLRTIGAIRIMATRAGEKTPVAYTDMSSGQIARLTGSGADIPSMLAMTPSVVATSDAGTGIGYTSMSIRGTDGTRINVTANGVPLGDAESHKLYWVNIPDFATSAGDIQIQRGVGTSTNGAGAFGASVNMTTEPLSMKAFAEVSATYGSWNTHRESVRFGTGMIGGGAGAKGRWAFSGRLSNIGSDGYVDRASADLKSYFVQGAWLGRTTSVKLVSFGGHEATYHAWNGLTADQMKRFGRRYNTAGEMYRTDEAGATVVGGDGQPVVEGFYRDQKDVYAQYNVQLIVDQRLAPAWNLNLTGHYTRGDGYYEEYKNSRSLAEYGLSSYEIPDGGGGTVEVKKSNLVRRKQMWNNFGGAILAITHRSERVDAAVGAAWNVYAGRHFGRVVWVKNYVAGADGLRPGHEYYRNRTVKHDANVFATVSWEVARGLSLWGDVQYRLISHRIGGTNDVYDWREGVGAMQALSVARTYHFVNPKAGVYWDVARNHALYASVGVAQKEPTRNDFTDRTGASPKAERLLDVELGYKLEYERVSAGVNLYYMNYRDQLVATGEVNDIGEPLATNVPKSFRAGVEMTLGWQVAKWLRWDVFGTWSRSRLPGAEIAYSPSVVAGNVFTFTAGGFYGALQTQYVGSQYLTNVGKLRLPHYCVTTLRASYRFRRVVELGVTVNNLFNARYSSFGYDYMGDGTVAAYFPQATIGALGTVTLRF